MTAPAEKQARKVEKSRRGQRPRVEELRRAARTVVRDQGRLTTGEIAAGLGVSRRTLFRWKHTQTYRWAFRAATDRYWRHMDGLALVLDCARRGGGDRWFPTR